MVRIYKNAIDLSTPSVSYSIMQILQPISLTKKLPKILYPLQSYPS
jgi:hypothetical protein